MLVLDRRSGCWTRIEHRSGDVLWIRLYDFRAEPTPRCKAAFEDAAHNFSISRPEAGPKAPAGPIAPDPAA